VRKRGDEAVAPYSQLGFKTTILVWGKVKTVTVEAMARGVKKKTTAVRYSEQRECPPRLQRGICQRLIEKKGKNDGRF